MTHFLRTALVSLILVLAATLSSAEQAKTFDFKKATFAYEQGAINPITLNGRAENVKISGEKTAAFMESYFVNMFNGDDEFTAEFSGVTLVSSEADYTPISASEASLKIKTNLTEQGANVSKRLYLDVEDHVILEADLTIGLNGENLALIDQATQDFQHNSIGIDGDSGRIESVLDRFYGSVSTNLFVGGDLISGELSLTDKGGVEVLLAEVAKEQEIPVSEAMAFILSELDERMPKTSPMIRSAVSSFLESGGRLVISFEPSEPMPLLALMFISRNRDVLAESVGLKVRHE